MRFACAFISGATSGIGEALAQLLASKGISLILNGRNQKKLEELKQTFESRVPVEVVLADLSSPLERQKIVDVLRMKKPDLVINNAGFGMYGEATSISLKEQLDMIEVDVKAVVEFTIEASKSLVQANRRGIILNVSSAAAYQIFPTLATYAASKAFVLNFSRSVDFELKSQGVRVLVSCPGQVATDFSIRAGGHTKRRSGNLVMTCAYAAEAIWEQIEKEKGVHIFNWKYSMGTLLSYVLPSKWVALSLRKIMGERR